MAILKISPEFECFPVWIVGKEGFFENIDPAQLPVSDNLKVQLNHFRERYDQTLNQDYPPDSGFSSKKDAIDFETFGLSIWMQLVKELGNIYEIVYFSRLDHKLYSDIQQYQAFIAQKMN